MSSSKEYMKKYNAAYYQKNKDRIKKQVIQYFNANKPEALKRIRKWKKENPDAVSRSARRSYLKRRRDHAQYLTAYREKYPEKFYCKSVISNLLRRGKINRPENCEICDGKGKIVGHHPDYAKPRCVMWVCRACHAKLHTKIKK